MLDLQRAGMWKRLSAALFDSIILFTVIVGMALLLSTALGYDAYVDRLGELEQQYGDEFGVDLNIIFGNIDWIGNHLLGELIVIASGNTEKIPAAIEYLQNKNVEVEVISHDDPA